MKDKIIFLSAKNPYKKSDWSGIPFFLFETLAAHYEVEYVPLPVFKRVRLLGYYFSKVFTFITGKKYVFDYGIVLAWLYGISGSGKLKNKSAKFIFSPAGLTETAFLKTKLPIVTYGDCSTLQLVNYYPALAHVSQLSQWEISYVERRSLKRSSLSFLSSAWAADFIKLHYGKTCGVIPFGSNLVVPSDSIIVKKHLTNSVNLLFIGVDWIRKGGDIALRTHQQLLNKGVQSQLTIVGVSAPPGIELPEHVIIIPNVNKDIPVGENQFRELFTNANFLLLPTIADCTPIAIAEAYAFGVPVLANNTGGLPSMVINDVTGYLMQRNDEHEYASMIEKLIANPSKYEELSSNSLQSYRNTFNWHSAMLNLKNIASNALKSS